eukprot:scaffold2378_cov152-Skeletonema_menzelii.AAC.8
MPSDASECYVKQSYMFKSVERTIPSSAESLSNLHRESPMNLLTESVTRRVTYKQHMKRTET